MRVQHYDPENGEGWRLDIRQWHQPDRLDPALPPVVLIPGYAMNTHVLGFHPEGLSLIEYLASQGFEVWAANLRGQGGSKRHGGTRRIGFKELVRTDLPLVFDLVRDRTRSEQRTVHAAGASLGGTLLYAYLAHHREDHGFESLVSIGGPLRWDRVHPLVRLAFMSPGLVARVPIRGTRALARLALPYIKRFPKLLAIYMNAEIIDLTRSDELVETVDDPHPHLNRQLAHWVRSRKLVVDGLDVNEALADVSLPILCILANADGIVPPEAVLSVRDVMRRSAVDVLEVGTRDVWFAHADLFVSRHAQREVFSPLATWLLAHGPSATREAPGSG